jgi:hypothetical protein
MFAAAGFDFVAKRLGPCWRIAIFATLVLVGTIWKFLPIAVKGSSGFEPLAEQMLAEFPPGDEALISSDATGEGMFIADVALHERRPGHVIQRASKSLSSSTWSGSGYAPAFSNDEEVFKFLTSGKIRYLILDDAVPADKRREHHDQLKRVVEEHPNRLLSVAESDVWRGGNRQPITAKLYMILPKN